MALLVAFLTLLAHAVEHPLTTMSTPSNQKQKLENRARIMRTADILRQLYSTNLREVEMGYVAAEKGHSPEIRRYGNLIVQDHIQANKRLSQFLDERDLHLDDPHIEEINGGERHKTIMARLHRATGKDFDRLFLTAMKEDHESVIRALKTFLDKQEATDMDGFVSDRKAILGFAERATVLLTQHLMIAESLSSAELLRR